MAETTFDRKWDEAHSASSQTGRNTSYFSALKEAVSYAFSAEVALRCAGVAFYGFLSLFPAIAAGVMIFGLVTGPETINRIIAQAAAIMPESVVQLLTTQLERLSTGDRTSLGLGLIIALAIALWSGSRGVNSLGYALTRANEREQKRGFLQAAAVSLGLTVGAYVVGAVIIAATTILPIAFAWLPLLSESAEALSLAARWPIMAIILTGATLVFYKFAPEGKPMAFSRLWPGAVAATLLWLGATFLFSIYVENFGSYDATFGTLAAVAILMLWMNYSAAIFVFGQRFNRNIFTQESHV